MPRLPEFFPSWKEDVKTFSLRRLALMALTLSVVMHLKAEDSTLAIRELAVPSKPGAQGSNLFTAADGTLHLTWSEPGSPEGERILCYSRLPPHSAQWSSPRVIVRTPHLMENWADFASLVAADDGTLTAQWFQRPEEATAKGYSGWFSRSHDGGDTWQPPRPLGQEFVSLAPLSGGRTLAVWLEHLPKPDSGARPHSTEPAMQLRSCVLDAAGAVQQRWTVDPDVCTCCQTTLAVMAGDTVLVAYRGHTSSDVRDHHVATFSNMTWTQPRLLHTDGWQIAGCPVNGPAADAHGRATAIAWFTAAAGVPKVQARFSRDGGNHFDAVSRIDLGNPLGRVDLAMQSDGSALVTWLEAKSDTALAGIYARRIWADGNASAAALLAESSQARASGFPRLALRSDGTAVLTFTHAGELNRLRTLTFDPSALKPAGAPSLTGSSRPPRGPVELCGSPSAVSAPAEASRVAHAH